MDILQATLASGVRVSKYVPSYNDQPNDVQHVVKCASPAPLIDLARLGRADDVWCANRFQGEVPRVPRTSPPHPVFLG